VEKYREKKGTLCVKTSWSFGQRPETWLEVRGISEGSGFCVSCWNGLIPHVFGFMRAKGAEIQLVFVSLDKETEKKKKVEDLATGKEGEYLKPTEKLKSIGWEGE